MNTDKTTIDPTNVNCQGLTPEPRYGNSLADSARRRVAYISFYWFFMLAFCI